jgi:hypothetical protein
MGWSSAAGSPSTTIVTSNGPSNVLLVQNLRDPATPYRKALNLRAALGDRARMVTVDVGGHGSYLDSGTPVATMGNHVPR